MENTAPQQQASLQIGSRGVPLGGVALVTSTALILVLTLYPYNFQHFDKILALPEQFQRPEAEGMLGPLLIPLLSPFMEWLQLPMTPKTNIPPVAFVYSVANVVFFVPLGISLAYLLRRRGFRWMLVFIIAQASGTGLSFFVETMQVFLPSRNSTVFDLITNSTGTFIGIYGLYLWISRTSLLSTLLSRPHLGFLLALYSAVILTPLAYGAYSSHLWNPTNWDSTYPLLIGNEQTGDRSWEGRVYRLSILDRVLEDSDAITGNTKSSEFSMYDHITLIADYRFGGDGPFRDHAGSLPDLVWSTSRPAVSGDFARTDAQQWLICASSVAPMAERIKSTHAFTVDAMFAPSNTTQDGPARIVSFSKDTQHRNLTIGQEGTDLIVRIRTPITGLNGSELSFRVTDILTTGNVTRVILTYDAQNLRIYLNDVHSRHEVELTAGNRAIWFLTHLFLGRLDIEAMSDTTNTHAYFCLLILLAPAFLLMGLLLRAYW